MKALTPAQCYDVFLEGINKEENGSLTDTEFEILFNEKQLEYLTTRAFEYEQFQKRIDDLAELKKIVILLPTNASRNEFDFENANVVQGGGSLYDLTPTVAGKFGYYRATAVGVEFNYKDNPCFPDGVPSVDSTDNVDDDDQVDWVTAKPMKSDKRLSLKKDSYNMPTDERPYYDLFSNGANGKTLKIINDTLSRANRVYIEYLEHPREFSLQAPDDTDPTSLDLPVHARQEVVNLCVTWFLERIESGRLTGNVQLKALAPE